MSENTIKNNSTETDLDYDLGSLSPYDPNFYDNSHKCLVVLKRLKLYHFGRLIPELVGPLEKALESNKDVKFLNKNLQDTIKLQRCLTLEQLDGGHYEYPEATLPNNS